VTRQRPSRIAGDACVYGVPQDIGGVSHEATTCGFDWIRNVRFTKAVNACHGWPIQPVIPPEVPPVRVTHRTRDNPMRLP